MIIVGMIGGLGNQMFQYALGRALSVEQNVCLRLDVSGFESYRPHRDFELARVFGVTTPLCSRRDRVSVLGWRGNDLVFRLFTRRRMALVRGPQLIVEPHFHYWESLPRSQRECYLVGFWQSEKYFSSIAPLIRRDFAFAAPLAGNSKWVEKMSSCESVSVHVRRGDYASDTRTHTTHGLCDLEYYERAISCIAARVPSPEFFVFSDDPLWARDNIKLGNRCHYVDGNVELRSYDDMRLMSLCKHHIIANSTFSWWGAWLNARQEKIVVAPERWFATDRNDPKDLIPESWIRV